MNKIKIKKEGTSHKIFIDDKDVSMSVKKINISLDSTKIDGQYALVDIQFITEIDADLEGFITQSISD